MIDGYVAMYLRISDDDIDIGKGRNESGSIGNQRSVLKSFINSHEELAGYPVREFLDDGYSGVNFNRPGIKSLLKEVEENRVTCIVVKDLSRFGRNYIEAGAYIEQVFPFIGVRFIAVSDHYDSSENSGGIEVGFKNLIHDMYSRDLSKKIKSVKQMHQEKGIYMGGDVPFGYIYSGNRENEKGFGIYLPDPGAAEVVRKIFFLAVDGNTPVNIAKCLNEEGIPTPGVYKNRAGNCNYRIKNTKRNLWTGGKVRDILQNEVYIGTYLCHKISTVRPRETCWNDKAEYMRFEDAHEALVSENVFNEAQKVMEIREKRGRYKKAENRHALQGKVKCGYCGYSMNRSSKKTGFDYLCRMGDSCGSHLRIKAQGLEETMLEILEVLISVQREKAGQEEKSRDSGIAGLIKAREEKRVLEMKMEHCQSSRLILYQQWKEQRITREEYGKKREGYVKSEESCQMRIRELDEQMERLMKERAEKGKTEKERGKRGKTEKKEIEEQQTQKSQAGKEESGKGQIGKKEDTYNFQGCTGIQMLTKELVDGLIERIDVYGGDRVEVSWMVRDEFPYGNKCSSV